MTELHWSAITETYSPNHLVSRIADATMQLRRLTSSTQNHVHPRTSISILSGVHTKKEQTH
jgi:hypothetical protein